MIYFSIFILKKDLFYTNLPIDGDNYPYVIVYVIYIKRCQGDKYVNVF